MKKKFFLFVAEAYDFSDAYLQFKGNFDSLEAAQAAHQSIGDSAEIATVDDEGNLKFVCYSFDGTWQNY